MGLTKLILLSVVLFAAFVELPSLGTKALADNIAITFDDLPSAGDEVFNMSKKQISDLIIANLKKEKFRDVYGFMNGKLAVNMAERLNILKDWKTAGFSLGNHTYSHLSYSKHTPEEFINDIEKNESVLIDFASDIKELKLLRLPYLEEGNTKEKRYALRSYLSKRGYRIAQVTIDFKDWSWQPPLSRCLKLGKSEKIQELKEHYLRSAINNYRSMKKISMIIWGMKEIKHILLLHFNAPSALWLPDLIQAFKKEGAKFIGAKAAIQDPFFDEDTTYVSEVGQNYIMQAMDSRKIKVEPNLVPQDEQLWLSQQCL